VQIKQWENNIKPFPKLWVRDTVQILERRLEIVLDSHAVQSVVTKC